MTRAVLEACWPYVAALAVCVLALRLLLWASGAKLRLSALRRLHADQRGAVQSLSFVITLPFFIMFVMLIVQVSQLMIATIVVHYASFAAARSAIVWIPAATDIVDEGPNRISAFVPDPAAGIEGPGTTYTITPGGPKYRKIEMAAVLACMPISPSRDVGVVLPPGATGTLQAIKDAYLALAPQSQNNNKIGVRLENKLAYSLQNTRVDISFLHKDQEPPPQIGEPPPARYDRDPDREEFYYNELGWQDSIRVTVTHDLCLLPGPGALLHRPATKSSAHADSVSKSLQQRGKTFVRSLTASVTLGNEGEKSVLPYRQQLNTTTASSSSGVAFAAER